MKRLYKDRLPLEKKLNGKISYPQPSPALEPKALREEPKMAESEWKRIFDSVPHIVFVLDSENRIKHANRDAIQALGLEFSQIVGRHCYEVIHNTKEPPPYCPHQVILKSSQGGRGELAEPRLNKIFDLSCSPIRNEQGVLLGSVQVLSDITETKRAEKQIRDQLERLAALRTIDIAITSSLDLRTVLSVFLDQVTTQLGVDAADILLLKLNTQMLEFHGGRGFKSTVGIRSHMRLGDDPASHAVLERKIIMGPGFRADRTDLEESLFLTNEQFISHLAASLIAKGKVNGVLEIWHRKPLDPSPDWFEFLEALTDQAAMAIDNAELYQQLQSSNTALILA